MSEGDKTHYRADDFGVLAVVVLYKMKPEESVAFRTLQAGISALQQKQNRIEVFLYDNTPGGFDPRHLPQGVRYEAAAQNVGLAAAYNRALAVAQSKACTWLLTLDQDTTLPVDYLSRMNQLAVALRSDKRVAAIVPRLSDGGRSLSPLSVKFWGPSYLPKEFRGIHEGEIRALNSASLFRVSALQQVGSFDPRFWLDYADTSVYRQLHLLGKKVYVAGDIEVEHELSLIRHKDLGSDRFRNMLQAESAFHDLYEGPIRRLALTARLLARIGRQRKLGVDPAIRELTWKAFKTRLFHSRSRRIRDWQGEIEQRMRSIPGGTSS